MDSFRLTISVHVVYDKLLYLYFPLNTFNMDVSPYFKTILPFSRKLSPVLFFASRNATIKQPHREELLCRPPSAYAFALGLTRSNDAFCPPLKNSQVSFPRVLSLFKMRTQCSDTTLSLVRAVLGTDDTLDCWLQAPDIRDLSRNLRSRCCIPREISTYRVKDEKVAKINDSCLKNCFLTYKTWFSGALRAKNSNPILTTPTKQQPVI